MEQIEGKNFLTAYDQLKGGGAITEIEGTKAEAAQARLSTAQNKKDWDAAMNDLETALRRDLELAQRKVNAPVTAWRAPGRQLPRLRPTSASGAATRNTSAATRRSR